MLHTRNIDIFLNRNKFNVWAHASKRNTYQKEYIFPSDFPNDFDKVGRKEVKKLKGSFQSWQS